jgi:hypothetical protein
MCTRQIAHMNIVADASTIWRWIIHAKHLKVRSPTERGLHSDFDEMGGIESRLSRPARRVGPSDVKLTQRYIAHW